MPILVPLFISAFRRADELATAMECRCYHGGDGPDRAASSCATQRRDLDRRYVLGAALLAGVIVLRQLWTVRMEGEAMRNIALTLRYLGTAYHGWQVQKNDVTVGQTLEKAAAAWSWAIRVHMTGCGRTDAGRPRASVYVANFRTDVAHPGRPACPTPSTRTCPRTSS